MDKEMDFSQFQGLDQDAKIEALKKMVPQARKEISQQRKLLTLAKESPNAWLHEDFLELTEIKIQEKEMPLKLFDAIAEAKSKDS